MWDWFWLYLENLLTLVTPLDRTPPGKFWTITYTIQDEKGAISRTALKIPMQHWDQTQNAGNAYTHVYNPTLYAQKVGWLLYRCITGRIIDISISGSIPLWDQDPRPLPGSSSDVEEVAVLSLRTTDGTTTTYYLPTFDHSQSLDLTIGGNEEDTMIARLAAELKTPDWKLTADDWSQRGLYPTDNRGARFIEASVKKAFKRRKTR